VLVARWQLRLYATLGSHAATIAMMHFVPGTFEQPENLSEGSKLFLEIMKEVTGVDMKPIQLVSAENVLKGNTECEEKLKKTIQSRVGTQEAVTLDILHWRILKNPQRRC